MVYTYKYYIFTTIYCYTISDGHRSFFPGSPIPTPIIYLFSYAILFLIQIISSLHDPFPIPILSLLPDPYPDPDSNPDYNIIYIFN